MSSDAFIQVRDRVEAAVDTRCPSERSQTSRVRNDRLWVPIWLALLMISSLRSATRGRITGISTDRFISTRISVVSLRA